MPNGIIKKGGAGAQFAAGVLEGRWRGDEHADRSYAFRAMPGDELLTVHEVAELLRLNPQTVRNYI